MDNLKRAWTSLGQGRSRSLLRVCTVAAFAFALSCSGERQPPDVGSTGTGGSVHGPGGSGTGGAKAGTGGGSTAGAPGSGGVAGYPGTGGNAGNTGSAGNIGLAGNAGTAGAAGNAGNAGTAGAAGKGGAAGSAGTGGKGGSGGGATGGAGGTGRACGARAGATCTSTEYCAYVAGQYCGGADAEATCKRRPDACTADYSPVCGCDGKTYSNACSANAAGTGVNTQGACATGAGN